MIRVDNIIIDEMIAMLEEIKKEGYNRVHFDIHKEKKTIIVEPDLTTKEEKKKTLTIDMLNKLI